MIDIYNQPAKTVTVLCHTSLGDILDEHGRFFTDYFVCPVQRERDNKLTEIGI